MFIEVYKLIDLHDIRYVHLGTDNLDQAKQFATRIVGLDVARENRDQVYLKSDQRDHTLMYFKGDPADHTVGFELKDPHGLDAAAGRLDDAGFKVRWGTKEECEQRYVRAFFNFRDLTGNSVDVVSRPFHSGIRYHGQRDAGITGFNHIGLKTTDSPRDEGFWTRTCNARVSDWIGDAALLRINIVHHTLALFPSNSAGIQHINHQVESVDDILKAWYFLKEQGVRIVFGPGRHPTSGAMFLYFEGPHGMVFEYSVGVRQIQPEEEATYRPRQFGWEPWSFCYWGAKPDIPEFRTTPAAAKPAVSP